MPSPAQPTAVFRRVGLLPGAPPGNLRDKP